MNLHFSRGIKQYPGFIMMRDVDLLCQIPCIAMARASVTALSSGRVILTTIIRASTALTMALMMVRAISREAVGFEITFHLISRLFHMRILNGD